MSEELAKRLQIKPGSTILVMNAPADYVERLRADHAGAVVEKGSGPFDAVHLFVSDSRELNKHFKKAAAALKPGGILWFSYPKKSSGVESDLTRDVGWSVVMDAGWKPNRQIRIDDVWAATRFKQEAQQSDEEALADQYKGPKADLLPIYNKVVAIATQFGDDVAVEARKSYVNLVRGTTFAAIVPATRDRVDLHFRFKGDAVDTPFVASKIGTLTHMISVTSPDDVTDEIAGYLHTAYERNAGKARATMGG